MSFPSFLPSPFSHSKERPWDLPPSLSLLHHVRHSHYTRSHHGNGIVSAHRPLARSVGRSVPGFVKHQAASSIASIQDPPLLKAKGREGRREGRATSICSLTTCCLHATTLSGASEIKERGFVELVCTALTEQLPLMETPAAAVEMEAEIGLALSPLSPLRPRSLAA